MRHNSFDNGRHFAADGDLFERFRDFFNGGGIFFAAKSVVDMADEDKDDRYHEYGCILAARFVVEALTELVPNQ